MTTHETYMQRCLDLAKLGNGQTAPNPSVGAVLVHNSRIIGEGFTSPYGGPHGEVNCINSVSENNKYLIEQSTIYVSLEPCAHFGKTPPCADLIILHKIKHAVIACRDPFEAVNGKGIEKLLAAGIQVTFGVLEKEAIESNKRFFTFHQQKRPYIILKWAQTADGFIAPKKQTERLLITNEITNRLVHKWRSKEAGIMVGTNTALVDNPSLTNRLWSGKNPVRILLDKDFRLPNNLHLFDRSVKTIVLNSVKSEKNGNLIFHQIDVSKSIPKQTCEALYFHQITSVLIEGGTKLLQSFIDEGLWDEMRVITNKKLVIGDGIAAPKITDADNVSSFSLGDDLVECFYQ